MGNDMEVKRQFVASLYPGESWKRKVINMPENQVLAIYFREKNKAPKTQAPSKPKESPDAGSDTIPF